jgi:hypothetical protein
MMTDILFGSFTAGWILRIAWAMEFLQGGGVNRVDENDSGKRDWAFAFGEFLRVIGIAHDSVVSPELIQGATPRRIIKREIFFIFESCKGAAPFRHFLIIADPDFGWIRVVFVAQTECEDLVVCSFENQIMRIFLLWLIATVSFEKVAERVAASKNMIRHFRATV